MATITITINVPDGKKAEVIDAFARAHGWNEELGDTKAVFVSKYFKQLFKTHVMRHKRRVAGKAAEATVSDIDIT